MKLLSCVVIPMLCIYSQSEYKNSFCCYCAIHKDPSKSSQPSQQQGKEFNILIDDCIIIINGVHKSPKRSIFFAVTVQNVEMDKNTKKIITSGVIQKILKVTF